VSSVAAGGLWLWQGAGAAAAGWPHGVDGALAGGHLGQLAAGPSGVGT